MDMRTAWQTQMPEVATADEIRRTVEGMERRMRRNRIDLIIAFVLIAIVTAGLAALFSNPLLTAGAVVLIAGFAFLPYEVLQHRHAPVAEDGNMTSIEYHRALLAHRAEFHRRRLWLRVAAVAPGGLLFFAGFAAARPDFAPFIYVQLATFILAVALIVPLNRKAASKLDAEIEALDRLRADG